MVALLLTNPLPSEGGSPDFWNPSEGEEQQDSREVVSV